MANVDAEAKQRVVLALGTARWEVGEPVAMPSAGKLLTSLPISDNNTIVSTT